MLWNTIRQNANLMEVACSMRRDCLTGYLLLKWVSFRSGSVQSIIPKTVSDLEKLLF